MQPRRFITLLNSNILPQIWFIHLDESGEQQQIKLVLGFDQKQGAT